MTRPHRKAADDRASWLAVPLEVGEPLTVARPRRNHTGFPRVAADSGSTVSVPPQAVNPVRDSDPPARRRAGTDASSLRPVDGIRLAGVLGSSGWYARSAACACPVTANMVTLQNLSTAPGLAGGPTSGGAGWVDVSAPGRVR
ncbi:hypothetical protein GCM10028790_16250 [Micromonospora taraxaci]